MKVNRRELMKRYSTELVTTEDIKEIQNLFDYASGMVIKNEPLANACETKASAKNADTYIKACLKLDDYNDVQREQIKAMYTESNKYYKELLDAYNIDPFISRRATDYDCLTSVSKFENGNLTLDAHQEELFLKCYKEAVNYYNNVTRTKSFDGEDAFREFSEVYLIFMAINRYVTERMVDKFNIDTFNKYQCKNYFISNGVDYFDKLPLSYQKKLIKLLNDLQKNKGNDIIFDYIKQILGTNNIEIYKFTLVKTNDNDLKFYKVPYFEELNPGTNEIYTFEEITYNDPYWRASKDEVLAKKFNKLETKYISIEYKMNVLKNSHTLSYFTHMLNELEIMNKEENKKTSLSFLNNNISSERINLYDAFISLYSLFLKYITNNISNGDNIELKERNELVNIYGYVKDFINDDNARTQIELILNEINELKVDNDDTYLNELNGFINSFNLSGFKYSNNVSIDYINSLYNGNIKNENNESNMSIKEECMILGRFLSARKIYIKGKGEDSANDFLNYIRNDDIESALYLLAQLLFMNYLPIEYLSIHPNVKMLFKNYLAYCIINDKLKFDYVDETISLYNENYNMFYYYLINNAKILDELNKYVIERTNADNKLLIDFNNNKNNEDGVIKFTELLLGIKNFYLHENINKYRNLKTFIEVFTSFDSELYKYNTSSDSLKDSSVINIYDFNSSFNNNELKRKKLEEFILDCKYKDLYYLLKKLWELKFVSNYDLELIKTYNYFNKYLMEHNEDLYIYVSNFSEENYRNELEEKILEISESIENYIASSNKFVYNSTLNIIFANMKTYAETIIEVFKAYTLDTIFSVNIIDVNDKFSNHVKIFDEVEFSDVEFTVNEYIDPTDDIIPKEPYPEDIDNPETFPIDFKPTVLVQNVVYGLDKDNKYYTNHIDFVNIKNNIYIYEENEEKTAFTNLMGDNKREPTIVLQGNRTGLVELNRNKSYIAKATYKILDLITHLIKINGIEGIDPLQCLIGSMDPKSIYITQEQFNSLNNLNSITEIEESYKNCLIFLVLSNGVLNAKLYQGNNTFSNLGVGFNLNYFKIFYENIETTKKLEDTKKVFHRQYLDENFISKYNTDTNRYNDIIEVTENYVIDPDYTRQIENFYLFNPSIANITVNQKVSFDTDINSIDYNPFHTKNANLDDYNFNKFNLFNNASLLSFTSAVCEVEQTPIDVTIEIVDGYEDESGYISNFAYIDVQNKGITDVNNSNSQEYLKTFAEEAYDIGLIESNNKSNGIKLINELSNAVYDVNPKVLLYNNLVYDNSRDFNPQNAEYIKDVYDSNGRYSIFVQDNKVIYEYDSTIENKIEKVLDHGRIKDKIIESHTFIFNIVITDDEGNKQTFSNLDVDSEEFFIELPKILKIVSGKEYTIDIYTTTNTSAMYNGNFIYSLIVDTVNSKGFNISNITSNEICFFENNDSLYTIFNSRPLFTKKTSCKVSLKENSNAYDLKFKLSGIITFETIIDVNSESSNEILFNPPFKFFAYVDGYTPYNRQAPNHVNDVNSLIMYCDENNHSLNFDYGSTVNMHEFKSSENRKIKICSGFMDNVISYNSFHADFINENNFNYKNKNKFCNSNSINGITISYPTIYANLDNVSSTLEEDNTYILNYGDYTLTEIKYEDKDSEYKNADFKAENFTNIIIPSSIKLINERAFNNSKIKSITFGPNLINISFAAFYASELEEIYFLNETVKEGTDFVEYLKIWGDSFKLTRNLKNKGLNLKFPNNLSEIYNRAFYNSTINKLNFSRCNYLYKICEGAFLMNDYLGRYHLINESTGNNILDNNGNLIYEGESENTEYLINGDLIEGNGTRFNYDDDELTLKFNHGENNSFLYLGSSAFEKAYYLKRANLGNTHTIVSYAFYDCYRLQYVNIPEIRYLGVDANGETGTAGDYYFPHRWCYQEQDENGNIIKNHYADITNRYININGFNNILNTGPNLLKIGEDKYDEVILDLKKIDKYYNSDSELFNSRLKPVRLNISSENHWSSLHTGDSLSYGAVFQFCYLLMEVTISDSIKIMGERLFEGSGRTFICKDTNNDCSVCSIISISDNEPNEFRKLSNAKIINNEYILTNHINFNNVNFAAESKFISSYLIGRKINDYTIVDVIKFNYLGTMDSFNKIIKKTNWNSLGYFDFDYNRQYNVDYDNFDSEIINPLENEKIYHYNNENGTVDKKKFVKFRVYKTYSHGLHINSLLLPPLYKKGNYHTIVNGNFYNLSYNVNKFILKNDKSEVDCFKFISFKDILEDENYESEFRNVVCDYYEKLKNDNYVIEQTDKENRGDYYNPDHIDNIEGGRKRIYKEDERADRYLKSINLLIDKKNSSYTDENSEINEINDNEYEFLLQAESKNTKTIMENNQEKTYKTVVFIDLEQVRRLEHKQNNNTCYWSNDINNLEEYSQFISYINKNTTFYDNSNPVSYKIQKKYNIIKNNGNIFNEKIEKRLSESNYEEILNGIQPKLFNTPQSIMDSVSYNNNIPRTWEYNSKLFLKPFNEHENEFIVYFVECRETAKDNHINPYELNFYNYTYNPFSNSYEYIEQPYEEKMLMYNDESKKILDEAYWYTANHTTSQAYIKHSESIINLKTLDYQPKSLNIINRINGITVENGEIKSYNVRIAINYALPVIELNIYSDNSVYDENNRLQKYINSFGILNEFINFDVIFNSLKQATTISGNTATIKWNAGISTFTI